MKIRRGFVSNSSSSSFVVVFNRPELSVEYLKEVLYYNADQVPYVHNWGSDNELFQTETLCHEIIRTMEPADTKEKLIDAFSGMSRYDNSAFPDYPSWRGDKSSEERQAAWDEYEKQHAAVVEQLVSEFMAGVGENEYVFVGEFSDNEGSLGSQLEHGDTFYNVSSVQINHH